MKFVLSIAVLISWDISYVGGSSAVQSSIGSGTAQDELEREVAQLKQTVRMLQSELVRTKTYGQASSMEAVTSSSAASARTTQAPTEALDVHSDIKDGAEPSISLPPALAVDNNKERALGNNLTHTAAYRQCYLHPRTNKFAPPPSNFVVSDEGFLYFEIPKVASTAIRVLLNHTFGKSSPGLLLERGSWRLSNEELSFFKFTAVRDPINRFVSTFNFLSVFEPDLQSDRHGSPPEVTLAAERWAARLLLDGWWNWHLWPQALYLSHLDGSPRAMDYVGNQANLQDTFDVLHGAMLRQHERDKGSRKKKKSKGKGAKEALPPPRVLAEQVDPMGGHFTREKVLTRSMLSDRTVQLVCQAYLADFCCFNFPWPEPCQALLANHHESAPSAPPRVDSATGVTLQLSCHEPPKSPTHCSRSGNSGTCSNDITDSGDDGSTTRAQDLRESSVLWRDDPLREQPRNPPHLYAAERNVQMLQEAYAKDATEKFATLR